MWCVWSRSFRVIAIKLLRWRPSWKMAARGALHHMPSSHHRKYWSTYFYGSIDVLHNYPSLIPPREDILHFMLPDYPRIIKSTGIPQASRYCAKPAALAVPETSISPWVLTRSGSNLRGSKRVLRVTPTSNGNPLVTSSDLPPPVPKTRNRKLIRLSCRQQWRRQNGRKQELLRNSSTETHDTWIICHQLPDGVTWCHQSTTGSSLPTLPCGTVCWKTISVLSLATNHPRFNLFTLIHTSCTYSVVFFQRTLRQLSRLSNSKHYWINYVACTWS